MREVYVPVPEDGFELCHPVDAGDFDRINEVLVGSLMGAGWRSPRMRVIKTDHDKSLLESDSPWFGSQALVLRSAAVDALRGVVTPGSELLPIDSEQDRLWFLNACRVLDALDEKASDVDRFSSGRMMRIRRYVFHPVALQTEEVFKIPNLKVSPTFVGERFVAAWGAAGLRGLSFTKVWSA